MSESASANSLAGSAKIHRAAFLLAEMKISAQQSIVRVSMVGNLSPVANSKEPLYFFTKRVMENYLEFLSSFDACELYVKGHS